MKNKAGIIIGFVLGLAGFLLLFKVIFLDHVTPDDELAPGIVLMAAICSGILFAFIGNRLQHSGKKRV